MKLLPRNVARFEKDQAAYGTKTALFNLLYLIAADQLVDLGCTVSTTPRGVPGRYFEMGAAGTTGQATSTKRRTK